MYSRVKNNSTDAAGTAIIEKGRIMKGFKFSHYISRMALNGVSIAVYCSKDNSIYRLVAEKKGEKIKGTLIVDLTEKEYEELPYDPYNAIERFFKAAAMCGIEYH